MEKQLNQNISLRGTSQRAVRIPLHEQKKNSLAFIDQDPNYKYRIVNDTIGRIEKLKKAGYEHVEAKIDSKLNSESIPSQQGSYASQSVGKGITGYTMRIKKEYYEEDLKSKAKIIANSVQQISNRDGNLSAVSGKGIVAKNITSKRGGRISETNVVLADAE